MVQDGITLAQAACLASCNGVNVSMAHHGMFSFEEFRQVISSTTAADGEHVIVSYSRKLFQQTGDGHFSPVGGFHPERELVLILDVARFKYPPHWVPLRLLFDAMEAHDLTTGAAPCYVKPAYVLHACICCPPVCAAVFRDTRPLCSAERQLE